MKFLFQLILVLLSVTVLLTGTGMAQQGPPAPAFESLETVQSRSGHAQLRWHMPEGVSSDPMVFELQEAPSADFACPQIRYQGKDLATFVSGLLNGEYYYRLRSFDGERYSNWSQPLLVSVEHHSRQFAFTLFALGLLVFSATLWVIAQGARSTHQ